MAAQVEQQPTAAESSPPPSPPGTLPPNDGGDASPTSDSSSGGGGRGRLSSRRAREGLGLEAVGSATVISGSSNRGEQTQVLAQAQTQSQAQSQAQTLTQQQRASPMAAAVAADGVDSALLSALRDPRERMALLKLERVLVGFMRERTTGYIEVGGQYNTIVIGGGAKVASAAAGAFSPSAAGGGAGIAGGGGGGGGGSGGGCKTVIQPPGAGRQTTFQRLCLHRLADRFGIVREAASTVLEYEGENGGGGGLGNGGNGTGGPGFQPTLIRLVKTKDSKIPPKLLIDLDPAAYTFGDFGDDDGVKGISRELSFSRLSDVGEKGVGGSGGGIGCGGMGGINGAGGANKSPIASVGTGKPRKMVIMKRSSSKLGTGSSESLLGEGSGGKGKKKGNKIKGKNLSDKEKAYAEARARILGEHADDDVDDDGGGGIGSGSGRAPAEGRRSSGSDAAGSNSATQSPSGSPPPPGPEPTSLSSIPDADPVDDVGAIAQEPQVTAEKEGRRRPRDGSRGVYRRDVSSSKVTWRNRRQEESDPDFRRGGSLVLGPAAAALPAVGAHAGPLHAQHQPAAVHYGYAAYANGASVVAGPIMVSSSPAAAMGHHSVGGVHALQHHHQQRGGSNGNGVGGGTLTSSPLSADAKGFVYQHQYYYPTGVAASGLGGGHGRQALAQAQAYAPQRGMYQYQQQQQQQQQQQSRGYYPGAHYQQPHQRGGGMYASARPAVADVHSMEEFPSLGGTGVRSGGGLNGSGSEKK